MKKRLLLSFIGSVLFFGSQEGVSKDLGAHGAVFDIREESLSAVIQRRLKSLEEGGELLSLQKKIRQKIIKKTLNPLPVQGIKKTDRARSRLYDPSLTLSQDLKDHRGRVFYKKGTKINPLETYSWGAPYLFFDGRDQEQVAWALLQSAESVWVLTGGSPLDLSKEYQRRVYFDQSGLIVKKFKITSVPAKVSQEGKYLLVEEIKLSPSFTKTQKQKG